MKLEFKVNFSEAPFPEKYEKSRDRIRKITNSLFNLTVEGQENVPLDGPLLIPFVHRSRIDPWLIVAASPRSIRGMVKSEMLRPYYLGLGTKYFANRGAFFVKRNSGVLTREAYDDSIDILKNDQALAMSPEGTSRNSGREIGPTEAGIGRLVTRAAYEGVDVNVSPLALTSESPRIGKTIVAKFGSPLELPKNLDVATISQRRYSANLVNEMVRESMQYNFDTALDLQH